MKLGTIVITRIRRLTIVKREGHSLVIVVLCNATPKISSVIEYRDSCFFLLYAYVSNGEEVRIVPRIVEEISRNTRIRMKKEAPCLVLRLVPLENLEPWGKRIRIYLFAFVFPRFLLMRVIPGSLSVSSRTMFLDLCPGD